MIFNPHFSVLSPLCQLLSCTTRNWSDTEFRMQALSFLLLFLSQWTFASSNLVRVPNDLNYWKNSGFHEMVPLLKLPSDRTGSDLIRVWVKLPENGKLTVKWIGEQNRYSLEYPAGTIADRVESFRQDISDVRGASIDSNGNTVFHVYETAPNLDPNYIYGYEWQRVDDNADQMMAEQLIHLYYPNGDFNGGQDIAEFRDHNHCLQCHAVNQPTPLTDSHLLGYESDERGFFQPLAVLQDSMTVRYHRPWDLNADDHFVSVWCGAQRIQALIQGDSRWYECPDHEAPTGKLDLQKALSQKDPHALGLCESRKYLYEHMDDKAQSVYRQAFEECFPHPMSLPQSK